MKNQAIYKNLDPSGLGNGHLRAIFTYLRALPNEIVCCTMSQPIATIDGVGGVVDGSIAPNSWFILLLHSIHGMSFIL